MYSYFVKTLLTASLFTTTGLLMTACSEAPSKGFDAAGYERQQQAAQKSHQELDRAAKELKE